MDYQVRIIGDCDLPSEVGWAFVRQEGCLQFWLKASIAANVHTLQTALEEAWNAFRRISEDDLLSWDARTMASAEIC